MKTSEVMLAYEMLGIPGDKIALGGGNYALPELAWIQDTLYPAFNARMFNDHTQTWKTRWSCREFARAFASLAQELWSQSPDQNPDDILLIGEIWFVPDASRYGPFPNYFAPPAPTPLGGHAICPCLTEQGHAFCDPQTAPTTGGINDRSVWHLLPTELQSTYRLRV